MKKIRFDDSQDLVGGDKIELLYDAVWSLNDELINHGIAISFKIDMRITLRPVRHVTILLSKLDNATRCGQRHVFGPSTV